LVGDDFRPLVGPDPDGPAYGNLLVSRLPLAAVEHLRFPPAGGGEQRTAILGSIQVGSRSVTVAATHLSNPTQQLDHILRNDPAGAVRPRGARVAAAPVSDHRALVEEGIPWFAACLVRRAARKLPAEHRTGRGGVAR
jgi:hypothetical protein